MIPTAPKVGAGDTLQAEKPKAHGRRQHTSVCIFRLWLLNEGRVLNGRTHLGENLDGGRGGVELASPVVRDPDAVHPLPDSLRGVFRGHDTLHHDLS